MLSAFLSAAFPSGGRLEHPENTRTKRTSNIILAGYLLDAG
jgi:hypothetical protein